ncbi:hypothetical protein CSKR_203704 [Clonorchis sinensis]|uniref:Uncharacterized protein n=1 Tax=Clonorchis sinensis TaxID=79923 RepID=A0A419QDH6_CLOSI|nr:hypothetical protein CSKR_203704 [Clonorchis sinensis]
MYYVYTCITMSRISYQLKHEATWCSTFSCLKTSQTRDSAGFHFRAIWVQTEHDVGGKIRDCTYLMKYYNHEIGHELPNGDRGLHGAYYKSNQAEFLVCDVSRQLNVLHQVASCFS